MNGKRQPKARRENERIYWDLVNQIDDITLDKPNQKEIGKLKIMKSVSSTHSTSSSTVQSTSKSAFYCAKSSKIIRLPTGPITGRRYTPPSSMEISSSSELMNFQYTYMPPTSTPWSTIQRVADDRTTSTITQPSEVVIIPPRSSRIENSTLPTAIAPLALNSYPEPVIKYQNRDLLDLGANIRPSTFHINSRVPLRSENNNEGSGIKRILTCNEEDCHFLFLD